MFLRSPGGIVPTTEAGNANMLCSQNALQESRAPRVVPSLRDGGGVELVPLRATEKNMGGGKWGVPQ